MINGDHKGTQNNQGANKGKDQDAPNKDDDESDLKQTQQDKKKKRKKRKKNKGGDQE